MSLHQPSLNLLRCKFEVAIICALEIESVAVAANLDEIYVSALYGKASGDTNSYTLGRVGSHHVVLAHLPSIGKVSSASVAANIRTSFSNIRLGLLVGVCGGLPFIQEREQSIEVILGDVIVGTGVVQYDFGRQYDNGRVVRKRSMSDNLSRPPAEIRSFLHKCQASMERPSMQERVQQYIAMACSRPDFAAWRRPSVEQDVLYEPDYDHRHQTPHDCVLCSSPGGQICSQARKATCHELRCSMSHAIARSRHVPPSTDSVAESESRIHWGCIASGDSVIKSGKIRDAIAREENVIAFEMEGSGGWEAFPMIVVKGVCDYADSHKNKNWQKFAALAAAAGAKALLDSWVPVNPAFVGGEAYQGMSVGDSPTSFNIFSASPRLQSPLETKSAAWLVPFDQREQLIGRSNELMQVESMLFREEFCSRAAIEGLGGVGKTRLSLEVAYSTKKDRRDTSVFWIQCSDVSSFERDCRSVLRWLEVPNAEDLSINPKTLMQEQLDKDSTGKWLLILDNADDEELWSANAAANNADALINFIPRGRQGNVLVTTRNHRIAFDIARKECVKLAQLKPSDSRLMFEKLLERPEILANDQNTNQLLEHLTHLPLAIVQAAAFINQNSLDDIDQYLQIWNDENEPEIIEILSEEFTTNDRYRELKNPIAKTWIISFKQISAQHPLAVKLLSLMACLDAKHIMKSCLPEKLISRLELKAYGTLQNYAFIQTQKSESNDTVFNMHRLVHLATRNYLRLHGKLSPCLQLMALHLSSLIPHSGWDLSGYWQLYVPHVEKVVSTPDIGNGEILTQLQEILANVHLATGAYSKSLVLRQAVIDWYTERAENDMVQLIRNISVLSDTLRQSGRFREGLEVAQKAFNLLDKLSYNDATRVLTMLSLVDSYKSDGRFEEALRLGHETLAVAEACDYGDRVSKIHDVVSALRIISGVYHSLRQHRDEERFLLKAIDLLKGSTDRSLLIQKTELEIMLAVAYCQTGKGREAENLLRPVRQMLQERLGRLHHLTLKSVAYLAEAYMSQKRFSEAKVLYKELLRMYAETGRGNDVHILRDRNQLCYVLLSEENYEEAKRLQFESIGMSVLLSGQDSIMTLHLLETLCWCYSYMDKRKLATGILASCVKRSKVTLGPTHPDTLDRIRLLRQWSKSNKANAKRRRVL